MWGGFKTGFWCGLGAVLVILLYLLWLWQPERQIEKHAEHLLRAIEHRDWAAVTDSLSADYGDQWGHDRPIVIGRLREVFRYVRDVRFVSSLSIVMVDNTTARWKGRIIMESGDGEVADYIKERVNSVSTPFELEWRRVSSKPWDWKLVGVRNPELQIPEGTF